MGNGREGGWEREREGTREGEREGGKERENFEGRKEVREIEERGGSNGGWEGRE